MDTFHLPRISGEESEEWNRSFGTLGMPCEVAQTFQKIGTTGKLCSIPLFVLRSSFSGIHRKLMNGMDMFSS